MLDALNRTDASMQESMLIDTSGAIGEQVLTSDYNYDDALRSIAKLTSMEQVQKEQKEREQKEAKVAQVEAKVARAGQMVGSASSSAFTKELALAKQEFGRLSALARREYEALVEDALVFTAKDSVLVSLSLQDQISELEKINLGMDENAFDEEKMRIIRQEVFTLYRISKHAKSPPEASEFVAMRDKRLTELKQKIELMAGQSPVLIQQNQQPTPL